jgi:hypothetical protein
MSLEIVTSFQTLMRYAHALGQARLSEDPERIAKAEAEHDAYAKMCVESDRMLMGGMTDGDIHECRRGTR